MSVTVRRIPSGDDHTDQKWLVLEGSIAGCPAVTKRRSINVGALVDGTLTVEGEKSKLVADVEEYHARYLTLQSALEQL